MHGNMNIKFWDCSFLALQNPIGHFMDYQVYHTQIPRSAHTVYLCVLCGSQNKQRLFPYTALTGLFL